MEVNPFTGIFNYVNQAGWVGWVLLISSIFLVGIIIERFYIYWKLSIDHEWLLTQVAYFIENKQLQEALHFVRQLQGCLASVFETALLRADKTKEELEAAISTAIGEQVLQLEKYLTIVGTFAVIAPFIGLFGTVLGIIRAFQDIALKGATGPAVVAKGVAEALFATADGLFVAITAVVFYNYFKNRAKNMAAQMHSASSKLVEMLLLAQKGQPLPDDLRPSVMLEKIDPGAAARLASRSAASSSPGSIRRI